MPSRSGGGRWGTSTPITIREKEFGAARLRAYGIYSYRIADARAFFTNLSGTREVYRAEDLEGQLRETIVARPSPGEEHSVITSGRI